MKSFFPNSEVTSIQGHKAAIIMRTLNRPVLLVRALASVLGQTHQDWHLYIVNDGGDKSALEKTLLPYRPAFDNRLTVIHHETSRGMEAASNAALKIASGDFLVIHDDDDAWHRDFLKKTTRFLNNPENAAYIAVASNCEVIHEEIRADKIIETGRFPWGAFNENIAFAEQILFANSIPPISLLIRKSVAAKAGLFNENLPVLGDWDYNIRLMQIGDIGSLDEKLAYYHHRVNQKDAYGNSVHSGQKKHHKYNTLYRNALLREFLKANPSALGLLQLLAIKSGENLNKINELLEQNYRLYGKQKKNIKYSGLFGKIRWNIRRFRKKLRKKNT